MSENLYDEKTHPYVDPYVGVTLDGRFRIVHLVGIGGMGRVYRAIQIGLNRAVALKILDPPHGLGINDSLRQRFLAEASMTAKLHHPNTVTVIDYGSTHNGTLYIAFEFLEGRTLAQVLGSEGALPWPRVLHIAQQVARSLRQAHSMGVVHRDLKPANIMLLDADSDTDLVKVLDFGLVKAFANHRLLNISHDVTQAGMLVGSPTYMSPEQGQSSQANPRSDLYALGIVMYECLSGNPPFQGGSPIEVILKHINQPIPPLTLPQDFPPLPQAVENLIMRCLAKRPEERPASMDEFLLETQVLFVSSGNLPPGTSSPYLPNIENLAPPLPTPKDASTSSPSHIPQRLSSPPYRALSTPPHPAAEPNHPHTTLSFGTPSAFASPQPPPPNMWMTAFAIGASTAFAIGAIFSLFFFHPTKPSHLQNLDDSPPFSLPPVVQKYNAPEELFLQKISSSPEGADVFLDGVLQGHTPLELKLPAIQEHQPAVLRLEMEGFHPSEFHTTLGPPIEKHLRPLPKNRAPKKPLPQTDNTPLEDIPTIDLDSPDSPEIPPPAP